MRKWLYVVLFPLAIVGGCQSGGNGPSTASGDSAIGAGDRQPAYRPGPVGIDDDSDFDAPSPIATAMTMPFRAVGNGFSDAFQGPVELFQRASGDTAHRAVLQMEDPKSADNRRNGLNRLMEFPFTHRPPYTKVYESMAKLDGDPTVRAAAIRACNRSRDGRATAVFIKSLSDSNELVRLEAAKALANVPDPNAAAPLATIAGNVDESRDVRIAAVDALKYYRTIETARVLSNLLSDHDFSVCWQARRSLVYLTHRDFGYDEAAWLAYFVGPAKPLG